MKGKVAEGVGATLRRGAVAGLIGTTVMTAFQKVVEMPITGRDESYAPANLATKLLSVDPKSNQGRRRLNNASHFAVGTGWGVARGAAERVGLRGQRAVVVIFGALWTGDVLAMAALGLDDPPWRWSRRDLLIDVVDKLVLAEAASFAFERLDRRADPH